MTTINKKKIYYFCSCKRNFLISGICLFDICIFNLQRLAIETCTNYKWQLNIYLILKIVGGLLLCKQHTMNSFEYVDYCSYLLSVSQHVYQPLTKRTNTENNWFK